MSIFRNNLLFPIHIFIIFINRQKRRYCYLGYCYQLKSNERGILISSGISSSSSSYGLGLLPTSKSFSYFFLFCSYFCFSFCFLRNYSFFLSIILPQSLLTFLLIQCSIYARGTPCMPNIFNPTLSLP